MDLKIGNYYPELSRRAQSPLALRTETFLCLGAKQHGKRRSVSDLTPKDSVHCCWYEDRGGSGMRNAGGQGAQRLPDDGKQGSETSGLQP